MKKTLKEENSRGGNGKGAGQREKGESYYSAWVASGGTKPRTKKKQHRVNLERLMRREGHWLHCRELQRAWGDGRKKATSKLQSGMPTEKEEGGLYARERKSPCLRARRAKFERERGRVRLPTKAVEFSLPQNRIKSALNWGTRWNKEGKKRGKESQGHRSI